MKFFDKKTMFPTRVETWFLLNPNYTKINFYIILTLQHTHISHSSKQVT